jgi:hypothetical protein
MTITNVKQRILGICLALLIAPSIGHAEIYKWVDANGKVHYSKSKEEAGNAKAVELRIPSQAATAATDTPPPQSWQSQERLIKQRQEQKEKESSPRSATKPISLSGGREDGTDASRCALARDVLSGAVRHPNGKPTDDYDRQVAENDIRSFCR